MYRYENLRLASNVCLSGMLSQAWHVNPECAFSRDGASDDTLDNVTHASIRRGFAAVCQEPEHLDPRNPDNRLSIELCSNFSDLQSHYKEALSEIERPWVFREEGVDPRDPDSMIDSMDFTGIWDCPQHLYEFINPKGAISISKDGILILNPGEGSPSGWLGRISSCLSKATPNLPH